MSNALEERLQELAARACVACGMELYHAEFHGGRQALLRVYIERPGGGTVSVDDCRTVSEQMGALLDLEDPLPGAYTLEVSSPGLDRELFEPRHYAAARGRMAAVKAFAPVDGVRYWEGRIAEAGPEDFVMEVGGRVLRIAYANVARARLRLDLEEIATPKKGGRRKAR